MAPKRYGTEALLMALAQLLPKPNVLALAAPRFEEVGALLCVIELRSQGLGVALLGLTSGPIHSAYGLALHPDATLAQGEELLAATPQLLVLAGGTHSAALALADPRTHSLIEQVLASGGHLAALLESDQLLHESGLLTAEREAYISWQGRAPLAEYVKALARVGGRGGSAAGGGAGPRSIGRVEALRG